MRSHGPRNGRLTVARLEAVYRSCRSARTSRPALETALANLLAEHTQHCFVTSDTEAVAPGSCQATGARLSRPGARESSFALGSGARPALRHVALESVGSDPGTTPTARKWCPWAAQRSDKGQRPRSARKTAASCEFQRRVYKGCRNLSLRASCGRSRGWSAVQRECFFRRRRSMLRIAP